MNTKANYLKVLIAVLLFNFTNFSQEGFGGIFPAKTNISEVRSMFDVAPKKVGKDELFFKLKEGNLFIGFSLGNCVKTTWGSWDLVEGTVIDILFYPKKTYKPSHFNLKKEGMTKGFDQGHQTYSSDELGLYYSTEFGKISGIHYYPSSKYKTLKCTETNTSQLSM